MKLLTKDKLTRFVRTFRVLQSSSVWIELQNISEQRPSTPHPLQPPLTHTTHTHSKDHPIHLGCQMGVAWCGWGVCGGSLLNFALKIGTHFQEKFKEILTFCHFFKKCYVNYGGFKNISTTAKLWKLFLRFLKCIM